MRVGLQRALWIAIAGLMAVVALEWIWPSGGTADPAAPHNRLAAQARAPALAARDTSGWVSAVLARPVFSISRRPPRVVPGHGTAAAAQQARLSGIMITPVGRRAIFAPEGGGHALVLSEGATVNDSTIKSIQSDRVIMASGTELRPSYDRNRVAAVGTPAFQPAAAFPPPGFVNPGFPNPGMPGVFPNPNFPGIQPQPGGEDGGQPPTPQLLRGNMIPQRRY